MSATSNTTKKARRELEVFRAFIRSARISVWRWSAKQPNPPLPDITCRKWSMQQVGFELSSIVDESLARKRRENVSLKTQLYKAYDALDQSIQQRLNGRMVHVVFRADASSRRKHRSLPSVLKLAIDQAGSRTEVEIPTKLRKIVKRIRLSDTELTGPLLEVGESTFFGDPVIERALAKFNKTYSGPERRELLLYYDHQDSLTYELRRQLFRETVNDHLLASPFQRVWVYDASAERVLDIIPSSRWTRCRVSQWVRKL